MSRELFGRDPDLQALSALLAAALGKLAREHGMREVAAAAGLSREALYKALRSRSQPRFDTINRVCGALGVKLVVRPAR